MESFPKNNGYKKGFKPLGVLELKRKVQQNAEKLMNLGKTM